MGSNARWVRKLRIMGLVMRGEESLTSRDVFNRRLLKDFPFFAKWAFEVLHQGERLVPTWHHKAIFHQLNRAWHGEIKRLVVSVAPRSLKSFIISVAYPAWILARNPACKIICVSYGESLSDKLAQDCRKLMQHRRYQDAFPDSKLETPGGWILHDDHGRWPPLRTIWRRPHRTRGRPHHHGRSDQSK